MSYPFADSVFRRMIDKMVRDLQALPYVNITGQSFVNADAPYIMYPTGEGYSAPGYELLVMDFTCPAIMDCRSSPNNTSPHTITSTSQVRVQHHHELHVHVPRTFTSDPIGWGIRFAREPPMYPNILCADMVGPGGATPKLRFSKHTHAAGMMAGSVCIGAGQDRGNPVMPAYLVSDLRNYLPMSDKSRWINKKEKGGVNDEGFEKVLFQHMSQNYAILKQALDESSSAPRPTPNPGRRKLGGGGSKPPRRKLGG